MQILITGSSGRVGAAIAAHLAPGHTVIGLDLMPGPYTTQRGDIGDEHLVNHLVSQVEAVIHTASLHAPHVGVRSADEFRAVNVTGTQVLLDACLQNGIGRFVYTSTTSLYGQALVPAGRAVWVTEQLVPAPRDIYDETKIAAEELCRRAAGPALSCLSLRISRCFPEPPEQMALYRLYRGVDLRDVAEAHHLALAVPLAGFNVFNISAASPFTYDERAELYENAARVIVRHFPWAERKFQERGWRLPRSIDRVYVTTQARQALGYRPAFNFEALF